MKSRNARSASPARNASPASHARSASPASPASHRRHPPPIEVIIAFEHAGGVAAISGLGEIHLVFDVILPTFIGLLSRAYIQIGNTDARVFLLRDISIENT